MTETNTAGPAAPGGAAVCPNCGGRVSYDIKSGRFLCESCRTELKVETAKDSVDEYSIRDYRVREQVGAPLSGVSVAVCESCGGEIYFDTHETAKRCPMCGSAQIRADAARSGVAPEGVVPFRIDRDDAQLRFRRWIGKRWFAPNQLKRAYAEGRLEGLYVPYWTFDADCCADYAGYGGRTRVVRDRDGNTRTKIDWYPVSGRVYRKFDDLLVCASQKQSGSLAEQLAPYDTIGGVRPFSCQYLAGYKAERYSIDGLTCFRRAQAAMEGMLRTDVESDILAHGFSQSRVSSFTPLYRDVTYKGVLVPMYTASYGYGGRSYFYAINGQTGKVVGSYPKSVPKILAAVLAAALVLFGLMVLFGFEDEGAAYDTRGSFGYSYSARPAGAAESLPPPDTEIWREEAWEYSGREKTRSSGRSIAPTFCSINGQTARLKAAPA